MRDASLARRATVVCFQWPLAKEDQRYSPIILIHWNIWRNLLQGIAQIAEKDFDSC